MIVIRRGLLLVDDSEDISLNTLKRPKILNTIFHTVLAFLLFMQLFLKILSRMVNSVDPDQTAPSGPV